MRTFSTIVLALCLVFAVPLDAAKYEVKTKTKGGVTKTALTSHVWQDQLPAHIKARVAEHYELVGSIRSKPLMTNMVLGMDFAPTQGLPFAVFRHVVDASPESPSAAMMEAFNIQILSPDHPIELPARTSLRTSLTLQGHREYVDMRMVLRDDAYYIAQPTEATTDSMFAADALIIDAGGEQRSRFGFQLHDLSGFTFNNTTVADLPPLGAPVTINIRYGDVRVDTFFQWIGRPAEIPFNDGVEFLR